MFVVRPANIRSTPRALARDLRCETRFYPNPRRQMTFDYTSDFFMTPVAPGLVQNAPPEYAETMAFATRNKYGQRQALIQAGLPAPRVAAYGQTHNLTGDQFVVRPLRHSGGRGYRVTGDRFDFRDGEYVSELYPKRREYRVIYVFGRPVIVLRKKPNEGVPDTAPWGHVNSRFQTINDVPGSRIGRTDAIDRIGATAVVRGAHIVAADVLYNDRHTQPWVVLELNFCPALDIDNNRATVVESIRNRGRNPVPAPPPPDPRIALTEGQIREINIRIDTLETRLAALRLERDKCQSELAELLR